MYMWLLQCKSMISCVILYFYTFRPTCYPFSVHYEEKLLQKYEKRNTLPPVVAPVRQGRVPSKVPTVNNRGLILWLNFSMNTGTSILQRTTTTTNVQPRAASIAYNKLSHIIQPKLLDKYKLLEFYQASALFYMSTKFTTNFSTKRKFTSSMATSISWYLWLVLNDIGVRTLRTQNTSDLRQFGTSAEVSVGRFGP